MEDEPEAELAAIRDNVLFGTMHYCGMQAVSGVPDPNNPDHIQVTSYTCLLPTGHTGPHAWEVGFDG